MTPNIEDMIEDILYFGKLCIHHQEYDMEYEIRYIYIGQLSDAKTVIKQLYKNIDPVKYCLNSLNRFVNIHKQDYINRINDQ